MDKDQHETIEYIRIGSTTYEVACVFDGEKPLMDRVKSAIKRDTEAAIAQLENPETGAK
ncbi:MAG: hypothetical protein LBG83_01725 [Oscillospiraceae bacterium]|nr:hypothetical protein [Oscillospiraceae bacterium]